MREREQERLRPWYFLADDRRNFLVDFHARDYGLQTSETPYHLVAVSISSRPPHSSAVEVEDVVAQSIALSFNTPFAK